MDNLVQFGFKVDRALLVKTGVKSGAVIEGLDVSEDGGAGVGGGRIPSSAATLTALRPLARHNSNASCSDRSVYLALLRAGFDNCVFMWACFRVLTP